MLMSFKTFFENFVGFQPSYSALVLDNHSHSAVLNLPEIKNLLTPEMEKIAHHMTIKMGGLKGTRHEERIGKIETIVALEYGFLGERGNPAVVALRVNGISDNKTPHVTVAVNRHMGAKPVMSNEITDWFPLSQPLELVGKTKELA